MNRACQDLVNAQTEINRAVFEANKRVSDDRYILTRLTAAAVDIAAARKKLAKAGPAFGSRRRRHRSVSALKRGLAIGEARRRPDLKAR